MESMTKIYVVYTPPQAYPLPPHLPSLRFLGLTNTFFLDTIVHYVHLVSYVGLA